MSALLDDVVDEFIRIPMGEGRFLGGRLWRPRSGPPVPAILEISPYRAFDLGRPYQEALLPYWAARCYGVLALDTAGSGGSSGLLLDEYLPGEIDDAVAAVAWCAGQDWCDGTVGMSGLSWAAFTALRAAARRPAALKALVLGGVSEDGWTTDIHNLGGAAYAARVDWAGTMLLLNALPPDPRQFGAGWRDEWLARLASDRPWIETWLAHPARDAYWAAKAVDLAALDGPEIPLLLYAGLADKYAASVQRIAESWRGPVRAILGPWDHTAPSLAGREPRIDFLREALRWWDHWLKGIDTGVEDDPPLRVWVARPDRDGGTAAGGWIAGTLKAADVATLVLTGPESLGGAPSAWRGEVVLAPAPRMPATLGADLYEDAPAPFDLEPARRGDGFVALTDPFEAPFDVAAAPTLTCRLRTDRSGGLLVARLLDVAPDGRAVRMTTGALDLAFHNEPGRNDPPPAGAETGVTLRFQTAAWRVEAGHRLGLTLHADGWPTLWPGRSGARLTIAGETLRLDLPRGPLVDARAAPTFAPPEAVEGAATAKLKWLDGAGGALSPAELPAAVARESRIAAHHLPATGADYLGAARFELALDKGGREAIAAKTSRLTMHRPDWSVAVKTRLVVRSTRDNWEIAWSVQASESGEVMFDQERTASVRR